MTLPHTSCFTPSGAPKTDSALAHSSNCKKGIIPKCQAGLGYQNVKLENVDGCMKTRLFD